MREIPSSRWNWTFVIPSCLRIQSIFWPSISKNHIAKLIIRLLQILFYCMIKYFLDTFWNGRAYLLRDCCAEHSAQSLRSHDAIYG